MNHKLLIRIKCWVLGHKWGHKILYSDCYDLVCVRCGKGYPHHLH